MSLQERGAKQRGKVAHTARPGKPQTWSVVMWVLALHHLGDLQLEIEHQPDTSSPSPKCLCGASTIHKSMEHCPRYSQLNCVSQRWQLLKNCNACFRCLKIGHTANTCSDGVCGIDGCKRMHHPSLHIDSLHGRPPPVTQRLYYGNSYI